jgi:hypothetical protein
LFSCIVRLSCREPLIWLYATILGLQRKTRKQPYEPKVNITNLHPFLKIFQSSAVKPWLTAILNQ